MITNELPFMNVKSSSPQVVVGDNGNYITRISRLVWFARHLAKKEIADSLLLCSGAPCANYVNSRATIAWLLSDAVGYEAWNIGYEGECSLIDDCCVFIKPDMSVVFIAPERTARELACVVCSWQGTKMISVPNDNNGEMCSAVSSVLEGMKQGTLAVCAPRSEAGDWPILAALNESVKRLVDVSSAIKKLVHASVDGPSIIHLSSDNMATQSFAHTYKGIALGLLYSFQSSRTVDELKDRIKPLDYDASVYFTHPRSNVTIPKSDLISNTPGSVTVLSSGSQFGTCKITLKHPLFPLYLERSCVIIASKFVKNLDKFGEIACFCNCCMECVAASTKFEDVPTSEMLKDKIVELAWFSQLDLSASEIDVACEYVDAMFSKADRVIGYLNIRVVYTQSNTALKFSRGDTWMINDGTLSSFTNKYKLSPVLHLIPSNEGYVDGFNFTTLGYRMAFGACSRTGKVAFMSDFDYTCGISQLVSLQKSPMEQGLALKMSTGNVKEIPNSHVWKVLGDSITMFIANDTDSDFMGGYTRAQLLSPLAKTTQTNLVFGCFLSAERRSYQGKELGNMLASIEKTNRMAGHPNPLIGDIVKLGQEPSLDFASLAKHLDRETMRWVCVNGKNDKSIKESDKKIQVIVLSSLTQTYALLIEAASTCYSVLERNLTFHEDIVEVSSKGSKHAMKRVNVVFLTRGKRLAGPIDGNGCYLVILDQSCDAGQVLKEFWSKPMNTLHVILGVYPTVSVSPSPNINVAPITSLTKTMPIVTNACCQTGPSINIQVVRDGESHKKIESISKKLFFNSTTFVISAPVPAHLSNGFTIQTMPNLDGLVEDLEIDFQKDGYDIPSIAEDCEMVMCNINTDWMESKETTVAKVCNILSNRTSVSVLSSLQSVLSCGVGEKMVLIVLVQSELDGKIMMEFTSSGVAVVHCPGWFEKMESRLYVSRGKSVNMNFVAASVKAVCGLIFPECNFEDTKSSTPVISFIDKSDEDLWQEIKHDYDETPLPEGWLTDGQLYMNYDGAKLFERPDWKQLVKKFRADANQGKKQ